MQIDVRHEPECAFIYLEGDLDIAAAGALHVALEEARDQGVRDVRVDVSRVGFVDSAGLSPLLRWQDAARRSGDAFSVFGARGLIKRVLRETHSGKVLRA